MNNLANRLQSPQRRSQSNLPTAIFGAGGSLGQVFEISKPSIRIGIWPIISATEPEFAMGLATILGLLLDRYPTTIRTYRLFAQLEGEPNTYQWAIEKSQFGVDDWGLDDLDENTAVWGTLSQEGESWQLQIEVENDLLDEDVVKSFRYTVSTLSALIDIMPTAVDEIANYLSAGKATITSPVYDQFSTDRDDATQLVQAIFKHELALFLSLWGQERQLTDIQSDIQALLAAGQGTGEFGAWVISSAVARDLLFSDNFTDDAFIPIAHGILAAFPESPLPAVLLSKALFESEQIQAGYDLLETDLENHPESGISYLTLAELYRRGSRMDDAVNTFQAAIESEVGSVDLYLRYANLLLLLDFNNRAIEEFIFIDPTEHDTPLLHECIAAYEAALAIAPDNLEALTNLIIQLTEVVGQADIEQLWQVFDNLVQQDQTGRYVRQAVDAFYNYDTLDIDPGIESFERQIGLTPQRYDLHLNLAVLYLVAEAGEDAERELKQALTLTDDPDVQIDINHLLLVAEDPEFEIRIGELSDIINAGNQISADNMEYLEEILERSPGMSEVYLLIARAYIGWKEHSSAIETLLDAHKNLPDDPEITVLLASTLWDSGEKELAFTYLNAGIAENPNYVPLLAIMGQYLFEDGQEEAAKAYLTRAERISPRDPVLTRVKAAIARMLGEQ